MVSEARALPDPLDVQNALEWLPAPLLLVTAAHGEQQNVQVAIRGMQLNEHGPPSLVIGVGPKNFTYTLIAESGEFGVNIPSTRLAHIVDRARELAKARVHGDQVDKFEALGVRPRPAGIIRAPLIEDCAASFECRVDRIVDVAADHAIVVGMILRLERHPELRPLVRYHRTSWALDVPVE
jgi:flavin reductase (DIM6/NTAB) family NADH-FMN oxidoreductase RutF